MQNLKPVPYEWIVSGKIVGMYIYIGRIIYDEYNQEHFDQEDLPPWTGQIKDGICKKVRYTSDNNFHVYVDSSNYIDVGEEYYEGLDEYYIAYYDASMDYCDSIVNMDNKGRTECFKCGCHTEQRRDFSNMAIREFCPRCKI